MKIIERDVVIKQYIIPDSEDPILFHVRNIIDNR